MTPSRLLAVLTIVGLASCSAWAQRELIARAAGQGDEQAAPAAARAEEDAVLEMRARTDLSIAEARLELILARKALKNQAGAEAIERARRALLLLRSLPEGVDASAYELQAEGILARAGAPVSGQGTNGTNGEHVMGGGSAGASEAEASEGPEGLDTPEYRYIRAQIRHQGRVREALGATEVRELTAVDEARIVPPDDVYYPTDWPQRIARRAAYADGAIARSEPWRGQDGKDWQVVIYDVSDITYVAPDFQVPGGLSPIENLYNALDRDALRQRSGIFNGYAEDLAAGIPLLSFFGGGIDPLLLRGPKYSAERQEQVVQMIDAMLDRSEQPKVVSIPPPPR